MRKRWLTFVIILTLTLASSSCARLTAPEAAPVMPAPAPEEAPVIPTPAPAPTPPSQTEKGLVVLSHSSYVDDFGYLHLVGEVENVGSQNTELNKVMVTFFDDEGHTIVTASNYTYLDTLKPRQKSPFEIIVFSPPAGKNYKLDTVWQVTENSAYTAFEITNVAPEVGGDGQYRLFGRVKNIGEEPVEVVVIVGSFYDEYSTVIATGFTFADELPLNVGENSPFMMIVDQEVSQHVDAYSLQAEGY